jgi:hypothetical protein
MKLEGVCTITAQSAPPAAPYQAKDTAPPTAPRTAEVVSFASPDTRRDTLGDTGSVISP